MTYKLHMSGVITGSLNCFCLACDEFFKSPQDATHHIGTSKHQKKADAVQFSDKFPDEHIKKFKAGYYCEFCNVLMAIASKVNIHITEDEHKRNKGTLLLKPLGPDVVAFRNVLIEEKAWHGLVEGVCSLCNAELDDENEHMTDAGHSLNMVLKPIQFGADNASIIFRQLDDTAVQCLTCNKLLAPGRMSQHFDATDHRELYAKRRVQTNGACRATEVKRNCPDKAVNMSSVTENDDEIKNAKIDSDANEKNKRGNKNNNEKSPSKDKSKIAESIAKYQTKGININLETETAFCKKCSEVVTFDFMEIENHIENHSSAAAVDSDLLYLTLDQNLNRVDINDKTTQSDDQHNDGVVSDTLKALREHVQNDSSIKEDSDTNSTCLVQVDDWDDSPTENFEKCCQEEVAKNFAKANKITYNGNNNQSYCRICEVNVPASLKSMKQHIEGTNHKRLVASSENRTKTPDKLVKQSSREFVNSSYNVTGPLYTGSIINEEYVILQNSFFFILETMSRVRCILCEINLPSTSDIENHVKSEQHATKWVKVPVIISEKNEFIREIRRGLYHCGFCNLVVSSWTDMNCHLQCSDHRGNRMIWELRLRCHLPALQEYKMQKQRELLARMRSFNMFRIRWKQVFEYRKQIEAIGKHFLGINSTLNTLSDRSF